MAKFFKRCRFYLALVIIIAALLTSLLRALTPFVAQYQSDIEKYLSKLLGQEVVIGNMETGWYWFEPVIKLTNLTIFNGQKSVLDAHQLIVGINVFSSLWHWQIEPGVLYVDQVHLLIHQQDDHWSVEGFSSLASKGSLFNISSNMKVVAWILAQQKLIFKDISADIFLKDGTVVPIKQFNLVIAKHFGRYKLKGNINVGQTRPTFLRVLADLAIDPEALPTISGEIYVYGRDVQPALWHEFLPQHRFHVLDGVVNGRVWLTLAEGRLTNVQSKTVIKNLDCLDTVDKNHFRADRIKGNWAWQKKVAGWQLSADQLELALNGQQWPINELKIDYETVTQAWKIYVRHVLLDSLFTQDLNWPDALRPLIQAKLRGSLQETQIHIKNNQLNYGVSRFAELGWHAFLDYPSVENISGVVHWQHDQGRLGLDGQNTIIKVKGKPSIIFQDLNAGLDWKKLDHGWKVNLDHLILRHPDLLASFTGSSFVENKILPFTHTSSRACDGSQECLGDPSQTRDDVREENTIILKPGVSVIPPWRPVEKMVSKLVPIRPRVGSAGQVRANPGNVKPTINLKGAVSATNAEFWMQYLPKEHLKPKLDKWLKHGIKHIDRLVAEVAVAGDPREFPFDRASATGQAGVFEIDGHVSGLDLIFAPLWPITRDIEADLHFDKRTLTADVVYAKLQDIRVDEVNLSVNDLGLNHEILLVHGRVRTTGPKALSYVLASPLVKKLPLLKLFTLQGMLSLDLQLEAPLYPLNDKILTKGDLTFDDNVLVVNHRLSQVELGDLAGKLAFDQEGVLDSRLKAKIMNSPMAIEIKSIQAPKSATLVSIKGELPMEQLRGKMPSPFLSPLQGTLALDSVLRITNDPGDLEHAQLTSSLKGLEIKLPPPLGKSATVKSPLTVDLDFKSDNSLHLKINYADLLINAIKAVSGDWSIELNEASIAGKILYKPQARKLTGQLSKLHLPQEVTLLYENGEKLQPKSVLNVSELPNIDLQIEDFRYGAWDLGAVDCKATSKESTWIVDYCKIKTSFYFIQAQGEWSQKDSVDKSNVDLNMTISDLGKTLTLWGITPVVDARHGEIEVSGAWPGGFQDFSLARIIGQALIVFRDGEITHLDAATEEKLGLGKLLSILSLQTLPRRLKLDFSDLVHKGYAFDAFRGNFAIARGIMQTRDSVIDGPTASASINGNLDIVRQLYDLEIKIAPHLTSSLPIVATIVGGPIGPIIGAATWVATKIINQSMQKFSAYGYQITGPWKKPIVKPIDIFKDWDKKVLGVDLI